ncbi:formin-like protein 8 [Arachis ipaensis]|uniref:formin-like protein 8 n=1 Tax=Arachis ipaensis TaxID=130454 RepID=UPI0007AF0B1B|nr:formin-like protein 8 [Arachis ipaensis]
MENNTLEVAESREKGASQTRLKPLHWDKVVANVDHSTVWDHINDGSFRFDNELIETLFGYSTKNQTNERNLCHASSAQLFLVDPRKSQNTSIVLRSLAISRKEIMDALDDGQGISLETLEKLTKIAPTQEEEAKIIQFSGNPDKLAHADSFLYCILKAVPTAFIRLKAMLFRSNYDFEAVQLKENLQTLEKGCKEMRASGLLLKFLEAILKAGNRMNAGTSRGNAQGFNLNALRKLPDVKSIDGKTSLLHFIVEQVAQSEGRREAMNQKHNIPKINGDISNSNENNNSLVQHETEKEYLMLGLQVLLGGIKDELSEVKKAAIIDHQNFIRMLYILNARVSEIREIVTKCCGENNERGGFVKEMKGFAEECEEELKVVKDEHLRIMELVKKTNEYYLGGGGGSNPFELFLIVRDFVDMVDEVCSDLRRKIEKKNVGGGEGASTTPPLSPSKKAPLRFPKFDLHFLSNMSSATSCSSLSDDDF